MEDLKRRAAALDERVGHLDEDLVKNTAAIDRLAEAHEQLVQRNDKDRRAFFVAILVIAAFVASVGLVSYRSEQSIRQAQVERSELWCPVFARAIGGYRADYAATRPGYQETHDLMREGYYEVLHCTLPLVPPAPAGS